MFPKGGDGKCISGSVTHRLARGDVLVLNATWTGSKLTVLNSGELVFWCFSLRLDHLFPLFASAEICLLQNVSESFNSAKLYPAASALAMACHELLTTLPAEFNLEHRSQLLRVAAAILAVEFKTAQVRRIGFIRPEDHMIQVFVFVGK